MHKIRNTPVIRRILLSSIVLSVVLMGSCGLENLPGLFPSTPTSPTTTLHSAPPTTITNGELQVIFFDVGQADCALVKTANHAMLIDAGNLGQDNLVLGYLASYGIKSLDYVVATHPHADHIGAMAAVIRAMDNIGTVLMPDAVSNTRTFENMLDAIEERDVSITIAKPGDTFTLGDAQIQILAPGSTAYSDLNDFSVVLRVTFGGSVFLFTGDADTKSENEQLASGLQLSADVLKVGHHGSRTSSLQRYLDAVSPSFAVISCGQGNSYGHPHREAMARLTGTGAEIYRTDENGTIIFTTDGTTITVSTLRGTGAQSSAQTTTAPAVSNETTHIGNINSKVFHLPTCSSLPQEQNRVYFTTRLEAIGAGYTPCSICKP